MRKTRSGITWAAAIILAAVASACAARLPAGLDTAVERSQAGAREIARHRSAAMSVLSAYYGGDRPPIDIRTVHESAVHAARVYLSVDDIRRELGERVRVVPLLTALSGLQYYTFDEDDRTIVAIRGTRPAEIRNWIANAIVTGARDTIVRVDVHEGFLVAARVVEASLSASLDRRRHIHLTGHSLGGALATLLALRLERRGYTVSVTTFGAPKLTTFAAFAKEPRLHQLPLQRIVNAGDVVPHFPTMMDATGTRVYTQFGREWVLNEAGTCVETDLRSSLTKSAALVLDRQLPEWSLAEHGMSLYVERLAGAIQCEPAT
jgi:hypothetical protein